MNIFIYISRFRIEFRRKCEWITPLHTRSLLPIFITFFKSLSRQGQANIFICETRKTMCSYRIESRLNFKSATKCGNHVMDMTPKNIITLSLSIKTFSSEFTRPRRDNIKTFGCNGSIGIVSASPWVSETNAETSDSV